MSTNDKPFKPHKPKNPGALRRTTLERESVIENKVFIGNLDLRINEYALVKMVSTFGKIADINFLYHHAGPNRGRPRGFAFVEFSSREEAEKCIEKLNGEYILGRRLAVNFADEKIDYEAENPLTELQKRREKRVQGEGPYDRTTRLDVRDEDVVVTYQTNKTIKASKQIDAIKAKLAQVRKQKQSKEKSSSSSSSSSSSKQ
eukprot:TRINITY_DN25301_c0_g1_i1.p1 TRINITY_DN25301_c0_g1~~TRINITY_DN25301_c0_g1_i1.p1  ORF type:complete len:202 (+),score=68.38 TRINITY_DN25301_c0_g1_i1:73-678(+)